MLFLISCEHYFSKNIWALFEQERKSQSQIIHNEWKSRADTVSALILGLQSQIIHNEWKSRADTVSALIPQKMYA
jgi:hypothetical protein